jgi:hypothetical protein
MSYLGMSMLLLIVQRNVKYILLLLLIDASYTVA